MTVRFDEGERLVSCAVPVPTLDEQAEYWTNRTIFTRHHRKRDQQDIYWVTAFRKQLARITRSSEADFITIAFQEIRTT